MSAARVDYLDMPLAHSIEHPGQHTGSPLRGVTIAALTLGAGAALVATGTLAPTAATLLAAKFATLIAAKVVAKDLVDSGVAPLVGAQIRRVPAVSRVVARLRDGLDRLAPAEAGGRHDSRGSMTQSLLIELPVIWPTALVPSRGVAQLA